MEKRNRYTSEFKTKVVLEVLREEQTVNEIAAKYELSPVMISRWKSEFLNVLLWCSRKKTMKRTN
ncbi:transposase [Paenibacillus larvae]|uniref:transposase n=1 Tax=Paenibacillus larvae TaxID=1464 RepID=UPI000CF4F7A6